MKNLSRTTVLALTFFAIILAVNSTAAAAALTLKEALELALKNSQSPLMILYHDLRVAEKQLDSVRAQYNPVSNLAFNVNRAGGSGRIPFWNAYVPDKPGYTSGVFPFDPYAATDVGIYYFTYSTDLGLTWTVPTPSAGKLTLLAKASALRDESGYSQDIYGNTQFGLTLKQPLSDSGRAAEGFQIARAATDYKNADYLYQQGKDKLIVETVTAYAQLLGAEENLKIKIEQAALTEKLLDAEKIKWERQLIPRAALAELKARLAADKDQRVEAENLREAAEDILLKLLGLPADEELNLAGLPEVKPTKASLAELKAAALQNRIELKQLDGALKIAELGIAVADSLNKPLLTVTGAGELMGRNEKYEGNERNLNKFQLGMTTTVNIPLMDGGITQRQVEAAEETYEKARLAREEQKKIIPAGVEQTFKSLSLIEKRLKSLSLSLDAAREAVDFRAREYNRGIGSSLDLSRAQLLLTQARGALYTLRVEQLIQRARLAQAVGDMDNWIAKEL